MSTDTDAELSSDGDELPSLHEMYEELCELRDVVEDQQETIDDQQETINELEARLEDQPNIEFRGNDGNPENLWIGTHPFGRITAKARSQSKDALERIESIDCDGVDELRDDLVNEQQVRTRADAQLERKIETLATEVDVDLVDSDVAGDDKIVRLLRHGPEDITDRVYPVHRRARVVLEHASEWGTQSCDDFGARITLKSTTARENLEMTRGESLQAKQVRDVFEKIVELAEDSPRRVSMGKDQSGVNRLVLHLTAEEVES